MINPLGWTRCLTESEENSLMWDEALQTRSGGLPGGNPAVELGLQKQRKVTGLALPSTPEQSWVLKMKNIRAN